MSERSSGRKDVVPFKRNRWFTGKLLDAYHMQLESDGAMHKRWLLNRLVLGSGVAIGLDVNHAHDSDPLTFAVTPGLAIDWHGREIIVAKETSPVKISERVLSEAIKNQLGDPSKSPPKPPAQEQRPRVGKGGEGVHADQVWIQLLIGYKETEGDPVPADFGAECAGTTCVPGSVYEGYEIHFSPTPAEKPRCQCHVPELVGADPSEYHRHLALWVTRHRPLRDLVPREDSALALANIAIEMDKDRHPCGKPHIDIAVREIVYYNDLLFQLILGLAEEPRQRGGK